MGAFVYSESANNLMEDTNMRTILNLLKTKGNVNVYLSSKAVCDLFLRNA